MVTVLKTREQREYDALTRQLIESAQDFYARFNMRPNILLISNYDVQIIKDDESYISQHADGTRYMNMRIMVTDSVEDGRPEVAYLMSRLPK